MSGSCKLSMALSNVLEQGGPQSVAWGQRTEGQSCPCPSRSDLLEGVPVAGCALTGSPGSFGCWRTRVGSLVHGGCEEDSRLAAALFSFS